MLGIICVPEGKKGKERRRLRVNRRLKRRKKSPFYVWMKAKSILNAFVPYTGGGGEGRDDVMDICPANSWLCLGKNRSDRHQLGNYFKP